MRRFTKPAFVIVGLLLLFFAACGGPPPSVSSSSTVVPVAVPTGIVSDLSTPTQPSPSDECQKIDVTKLHIIFAKQGYSSTFHVKKGHDLFVITNNLTAKDTGDKKVLSRSGADTGIYEVGLYGDPGRYEEDNITISLPNSGLVITDAQTPPYKDFYKLLLAAAAQHGLNAKSFPSANGDSTSNPCGQEPIGSIDNYVLFGV